MLKEYRQRPLLSISEDQQNDIRTVMKEFSRDFLTGATHGTVTHALSYFLNPDYTHRDLTAEAISVINAGFLFAASPFVTNVSFILARPRNPKSILPFVITTSVITTAVVHTVRTALNNWYLTGTMSLQDWQRDFARTAAGDAGFRVGTLFGNSLLPPSHKMGGSFARSTALFTVSDLSSTMCMSFFGGYSPFDGFRMWLGALPELMFSNALMVGIHKAIGP